MPSSGTNQQQSTFMDMVSKRLPRAVEQSSFAFEFAQIYDQLEY